MKKREKKTTTKSIRNRCFRGLFCILLCLFLAFFLYACFHLLTDPDLIVESYSLQTDLSSPLRIVEISDLHNGEIGRKNQDVVEKIAELKPDLIVMAGDMINRGDEDTSVMEQLVRDLALLAPVYYGYGNHEFFWDQETGFSEDQTIADRVRASGGHVLEKTFEDLTIKGNKIRLGGYMGYYHFPGMMVEEPEDWQEDLAFFDAFEDSKEYKILINHIPTQWIDWNHVDDFDVDLVLSGHYHGGQWVLPVVGPVFAPYVQWFPDRVKGVFAGSKATCVLTSGLGNEYPFVPRINNPPEIVVVDLTTDVN